MRFSLRAAIVAALALLAVLLAPTSAGAITGGTYDAANRYSNVGIIVFYTEEGRFRCSATLVAPKVLLTAAHCTEGTLGKTIVSFDKFIDDAPPSNLPRAKDDPGTGISATGYTSAPSGWYAGTAYTHPEYSGFTDLRNWNDVGVVVLDTAPTGITPAPLAPLNYLEQFAQPRLNKTSFTAVGYGTEVRQAPSGPQKPTPMSYPIQRRYTDVIGQKLTPQILQVNGNEHDPRAGGGTCFGDSGGPLFKNGYVVTVTSYGYTSNCRYLDGMQRVDIKVVQDWLAKFGVVPAAAAA
jgi:hypothetical protein